MMIVCAHAAHNCPGYPGQSAQSNNNVGGEHDISENALLKLEYRVCTNWCHFIDNVYYMYVDSMI